MTAIHVNDAEAGIIRAALAEYAESIRQQARLHGGGYSVRAIELNVMRLNVEAVIEAFDHPPVPVVAPAGEGDRLVPIDCWHSRAA
ncbi:MAG TPA: hypothetical protein VER03_26490 [Bryobacteraceae bacterium]|nr:hypothetical protein [Bryobacteraceae bacterium]